MAILTLLFPKQAQALEVPMPRRRRMVQGVESSQDLARKLEVLEHDGHGKLTFDERPFVVMIDRAYVDMGTVDRATKLEAAAAMR